MNKSFYFQHDYNASNDFKILFLRQQLGIEAYGIYWYIIEQLAQSNGKMPLKIIPVIAMQIQTTADKVAAVIKNYDLFVIENDEFFSVRLLQNIGWREQKSIDGKSGALKRWGNKDKNSIPNGSANSKTIADKGDIEDKGYKGDINKNIVYDLNSNPQGLYIIVKDGLIAIKIHQQSFDQYLNGTFGPAYEGQQMALRNVKPPIESFFLKNNGNIYNNNEHLWSAFKKLWVGSNAKPRNPGKLQ